MCEKESCGQFQSAAMPIAASTAAFRNAESRITWLIQIILSPWHINGTHTHRLTFACVTQ
jgi:hypothetical protein